MSHLPPMPENAAYPVTERSRARRLYKRVAYDRAAVHAILDAAPLCHVGYIIDD